MFKSITLASCIVGSFALMPAASAHEQHYQNGDPASLALGIAGAIAGAAISGQQAPGVPPLCEMQDGEKYYATPVDGRWECEED